MSVLSSKGFIPEGTPPVPSPYSQSIPAVYGILEGNYPWISLVLPAGDWLISIPSATLNNVAPAPDVFLSIAILASVTSLGVPTPYFKFSTMDGTTTDSLAIPICFTYNSNGVLPIVININVDINAGNTGTYDIGANDVYLYAFPI
jgi:hypothetical protein